MNRIAEIKERLAANRGAYHKQIVEDYEYLLAKLERAEKLIEKMASGDFHKWIDMSSEEAYQGYAKAILEAIRE